MSTIAHFQQRVSDWIVAAFGLLILKAVPTRTHRFLEEALELAQAAGCTKHDAMMLVDYVYGRPVGVPAQEVGGVALTLASLCTALNLDQEQCGEMELERVWLKIDQIRAKEAKKRADSALPGGAVVDHIGICPSCKARIYTAHPHICNKHQAPVVAA